MAEKLFKPGDQVKLKSGGPAMTVEGYRADGKVEVAHFDGGQLVRNAVAESVLVAAA